MNCYLFWKYVVMVVVFVIGFLYILFNFFGEVLVVQVLSGKVMVKFDLIMLIQVELVFVFVQIKLDDVIFENMVINVNICVCLKDIDMQLCVKDLLQKLLNVDLNDLQYVVVLNLQSVLLCWLIVLYVLLMYFGFDLCGGVYFLFQVDMMGVFMKKFDFDVFDVCLLLCDKNICDGGVSCVEQFVVVNFSDVQMVEDVCKVFVVLIIEL